MKKLLLGLVFLSTNVFAESCLDKLNTVAPKDIVGKDPAVIALWIENYDGAPQELDTDIKRELAEYSKISDELVATIRMEGKREADYKKIEQLRTEKFAITANIKELKKDRTYYIKKYTEWLETCKNNPKSIVKSAAIKKLEFLNKNKKPASTKEVVEPLPR